MIPEDPNTPPSEKMEENFATAIMKEIDKVDSFFTIQENQFYAEFRNLCQKVCMFKFHVVAHIASSALDFAILLSRSPEPTLK